MKIKTISITMFAIALLTTMAFAADLISVEKVSESVILKTAEKTSLASIGIIKPIADPLECDGDTCRTCLTDNSSGVNVGAGCISFAEKECTATDEEGECTSYKTLSAVEKDAKLKEEIKSKMEFLATVVDKRAGKTEKEISTKQLEVTITDK